MNRFLPVALALTFVVGIAPAQPLEGFHIVEGIVSAAHGLQLTPQVRLRTRNTFQTLEQVRAGLILTQTLRPGLDAIAAGYYEPTVRSPKFLASYRLQLGGQARLPLAGHFVATPRMLWERLNRSTGLAYRRVRIGGRLTWSDGRFNPYLYSDTFLAGAPGGSAGPVNGIFHSSRAGAGLGLRASAKVRLEFEYFYDVRRAFWGGDRQVVTTRMQFR